MLLAASLLTLLLLLSSHCNAQTIYAVVLGNQKYVVGSSTLHSGLFMSRDTGATWRQLGPRNLKGYEMDAIDSSRGRILFIAAGNGVHRSTDHGATWRITTGWRMTEVMDVTVDQGDPRWVHAATAFGYWRSSDGGDSWENPSGSLKEKYIYKIDTLGRASTLVASADDALYRSDDRGATWIMMFPLDSPHGIAPIDSDSILVATATGLKLLFRNGTMWRRGSAGPNAPTTPIYDIAMRSATAPYAVGANGIAYRSTEDGDTVHAWTGYFGEAHNRNIHAIEFLGSGHDVIGTFGDGVFLTFGSRFDPAGLEGSQVWSITVKDW